MSVLRFYGTKSDRHAYLRFKAGLEKAGDSEFEVLTMVASSREIFFEAGGERVGPALRIARLALRSLAQE